MPHPLSALALACCAFPTLVVAQSDAPPATSAATTDKVPAASTDAAADEAGADANAPRATPVLLDTVLVAGERGSLPRNLPATTEGVTAEQLRERVFVNVEDALKYAPNLNIRKRFAGDRNALIAGRSSSNLQAARGVVYADGVLLSNFLGNFNAPRWNMVAPEEVQRVDVFYGPFSALYPGNSIGTTVLITTREPEGTELSGRVQAFSQTYEDYGYEDDYRGQQSSAFAGTRVGRLKLSVGFNRLDNESQPLQYASPDTRFNPAVGTPVEVTGAVADLDPQNTPRLILGPNGTALEDDQQDQAKLKASYDFGPVEATLLSGFWRNDYSRRGVSFLRDAAGNPVYAGNIRVDGRNYTVAPSAFAPQSGVEEHWMNALTLRTDRYAGWAFSTVASVYNIARDDLFTSLRPPPEAAVGGAGQIFDGSGTGWWNVDVQGNWRSAGKAYALTVGYYHSRYTLENLTRNASDYRRTPTTLSSGFFGKTLTQAVYAQEVWRFLPDWSTTVGLRAEHWEAFDGLRSNATRSVGYAGRELDALSPKVSLKYAPGRWSFRYSAAKGVRFPTVSELFQGSISGVNIVNNDPNLDAETAYAQDLTAERDFARGAVRLSLYRDDIRDTINSQTNLLVTPNVTNIQNIPRVVTNGIELSTDWRDVPWRGLSINANSALVDSRIRDNPAFAPSEGKRGLRVPRVRANLVLDQKLGATVGVNLAVRHSGRQFNTLDNSDVNPDVFGGTSNFTVVDTKLTWRAAPYFEFGLGVENLLDTHYYVFHPYPGRTFLVEGRGSF